MGTVQTVLGPIDAGALGSTLSHVHLTLDIRCWYQEPPPALRELATQPLGLANLGLTRRNGLMVRDNLVQGDVALTIREAAEWKRAGGGSFINMDLPGIGRDIAALQQISRATGIHIVASSGWYTQASHPAVIAESSVEQLADAIERELVEGIDDTGVRAGNIGEIGMSGMPGDACLPDEAKVLRAAARAQARTGASLTVHPNAGTHGSRGQPIDHLDSYLDVLEKEGADLGRVYMSHMGFFPFATARRVLERGLGYVSYDHFGHEEYYELIGPGRGFPRDKEEIDLVMRLIEAGFEKRVLIANEIGWKTCYKAYGGWGYSHVLEHVVPWLRDCGASDAALHAILVENPARLHGQG